MDALKFLLDNEQVNSELHQQKIMKNKCYQEFEPYKRYVHEGGDDESDEEDLDSQEEEYSPDDYEE